MRMCACMWMQEGVCACVAVKGVWHVPTGKPPQDLQEEWTWHAVMAEVAVSSGACGLQRHAIALMCAWYSFCH